MAVVVLSLALVAVLALCAPQGVAAGWGACPKAPAVQADFSLEKYFGKWYELARFNYTFEKNAFCVNANYSLKADGHVKVDNRERYDSIHGKIESAIGDATIPNPKEPAKFAVKFGAAPVRAPYWVIHTDYTDVAFVYSCFNLEVYHEQYAWILSRKPVHPMDQIKALIAKYEVLTGVNGQDFYITPQAGCTY